MHRICLAALLFAGCTTTPGTDTTDTDTDATTVEDACTASIVAGDTTTDACPNASIEVASWDGTGADLTVVLGTDTSCLTRQVIDDACGAGRYWVGGGASVNARLEGCGGTMGLASSGSVVFDALDVTESGDSLGVRAAGSANFRVEGEAVSVTFDVSRTTTRPASPAFASCTNVTVDDTYDRDALTPGLDVLFVTDDRAAMAGPLSDLDSVAGDLLGTIQGVTDDYHVGVIRMDSGELTSAGGTKWIDGNTPMGVTVLRDLLDPRLGNASPTGRRAIQDALSEPLVSGANAGFYRDGAELALVIISNVNDASDEDPSLVDFTNFLAELKQFGPGVSAGAIVGPFAGCADAEPGGEFSTVAVATRGTFVNLCTGDYATALDHLDAPIPSRGVRLDDTPVLGSIRVSIVTDATELDLVRGQDWTWEDPFVAVERELIPDGDFTLNVSYTPAR
jgi:hypothetical protein